MAGEGVGMAGIVRGVMENADMREPHTPNEKHAHAGCHQGGDQGAGARRVGSNGLGGRKERKIVSHNLSPSRMLDEDGEIFGCADGKSTAAQAPS